MVLMRLDFHLDEVERCLEASGGSGLEAWRKGTELHGLHRMGFLTNRSPSHPLSGQVKFHGLRLGDRSTLVC
jgi:hypothetical protein